MTAPRKRPATPSPMNQAIDMAALTARIDATEHTIESLSQTVNKVADQVQHLSSITQVLTNASDGMTQHLVSIDTGMQRMLETRYELLETIRKEQSDLATKHAVIEARVQELTASHNQTSSRSFTLSNNAIGWGIAVIMGLVTLFSVISQHWR